MGAFNAGVLVTVAIFMAGVIFQCGRFSSRLDSLESWRNEVRDDIRAIRRAVDKMLGLASGAED